MEITVVHRDAGEAALCGQKYAVMSDAIALGTSGLSGCTGVVLFPANGAGLSAVAHVESRTDKAVYRDCMQTALAAMLKQMKKQDGTGMAVVLLGAGGAGSGAAVEDDRRKLLAIITGCKIAESEILDLRFGSRHGLGGARLDADVVLPSFIGAFTFSPTTRTLVVLGFGGVPKDLGGVAAFRIQEDEGVVAGTGAGAKTKSCCCSCVIL